MKIEKKKKADAERYKKKAKLSEAAALEYKKKKTEYDAKRYQKMKAESDRVSLADLGKRVYPRPVSLLDSKPQYDPYRPTITKYSTPEEIRNALTHDLDKVAEKKWLDDINKRYNHCTRVQSKMAYLSFFPELKRLDEISDYSTNEEVWNALVKYVGGERSNPMYSDETRTLIDNYIILLGGDCLIECVQNSSVQDVFEVLRFLISFKGQARTANEI